MQQITMGDVTPEYQEFVDKYPLGLSDREKAIVDKLG